MQTSFKNALQVTLDLLGTRQLPHNLHVVFLDGWRQLDNHLQPLFVNSEAEAIKKNRTQLWNYYSEKALRQRRPSKGLVPQMEGLHVFSATSLPVTDKPRLLYEGTCRGTTVGPIAVSQYDSQDVWKLAPGDKKAMLGKAGKNLELWRPDRGRSDHPEAVSRWPRAGDILRHAKGVLRRDHSFLQRRLHHQRRGVGRPVGVAVLVGAAALHFHLPHG